MATINGLYPSSSASQTPVSAAGFDLAQAMATLEYLQDISPSERAKIVHRLISAYYAGIRAATGSETSGVSLASSGKAPSSARSSNVRAGVYGRAGFSGPRLLPKVPMALVTARAVHTTEGFCYLRAFKETTRDVVKRELGQYPDFFQILAQPVSRLVPQEQLDSVGFVHADGLGHLVEDVGPGTVSLLQVLKSLSNTTRAPPKPDSVRSALQGSDVVVAGLSASCKVGGTAGLVDSVFSDVKRALAGERVTAPWLESGLAVRRASAYITVSAYKGERVVRVCVPVAEELRVDQLGSTLGLPFMSVRTRRGGETAVRVASYSDGVTGFNVGYAASARVSSTSSLMDSTDGVSRVMDTIATGHGGVHVQMLGAELDCGPGEGVAVWRQSESPMW